MCACDPQRPEGCGKGGGVSISSADGGSSLCGSMMEKHVLKNFLSVSMETCDGGYWLLMIDLD